MIYIASPKALSIWDINPMSFFPHSSQCRFEDKQTPRSTLFTCSANMKSQVLILKHLYWISLTWKAKAKIYSLKDYNKETALGRLALIFCNSRMILVAECPGIMRLENFSRYFDTRLNMIKSTNLITWCILRKSNSSQSSWHLHRSHLEQPAKLIKFLT